MAKNNDRILDAFIIKIGEINEKLETLRWYTENHMESSPEEISWGHVGTAEHILEQLDELIEFLGITKGGEK